MVLPSSLHSQAHRNQTCILLHTPYEQASSYLCVSIKVVQTIFHAQVNSPVIKIKAVLTTTCDGINTRTRGRPSQPIRVIGRNVKVYDQIGIGRIIITNGSVALISCLALPFIPYLSDLLVMKKNHHEQHDVIHYFDSSVSAPWYAEPDTWSTPFTGCPELRRSALAKHIQITDVASANDLKPENLAANSISIDPPPAPPYHVESAGLSLGIIRNAALTMNVPRDYRFLEQPINDGTIR